MQHNCKFKTSKLDIETVEHENWINDNVVNHVAYIITKDSNFQILESHHSKRILNYNKIQNKELKKTKINEVENHVEVTGNIENSNAAAQETILKIKKCVIEGKRLLLPVCVSSHWFLIQIDKKCVNVYDSASPYSNQTAYLIFNTVKEEIGLLNLGIH
jgi:hypothetical protein